MSDDYQQEDTSSQSEQQAISQYASEAKRVEQDIFTSFIECMIAEGYPADKIMEAIFNSLKHHQIKFKYFLKQLVGCLHLQKIQLRQALQRLPILADVGAARSLINNLVPHMSQGMKRQVLQQHFWIYSLSQKQIVNKFGEHGYSIKTKQDNAGNIEFMLLVTPSMREMYHKHGDCLSIDLIDRLYKKRLPFGFTQYSVWFLSGQNEHLTNVLFGFAIVNQQKDSNFQDLLRTFFSEVDEIIPKSICIPPSIALHCCLQNMYPDILVFVNWYHKLKLLKQVLNKQIEHRSILQTICECFKTPSIPQLNCLLSKVLSKVSDQSAIYWGVQENPERFCMSCIASNYIGFSIEPKKYIDLESEVRKIFIYQSNIARVFIYAIKLQTRLNKNISDEKQNEDNHLFESPNQVISQELQRRLELIYTDSKLYKLEIINPTSIRVCQGQSRNLKQKIFMVIFNVQADHWECNCGFLWHSGIPCAHLIKVIGHFGGDTMYYINQRWKIYTK